MSTLSISNNSSDVATLATKFLIGDRLRSLEYDVNRCLKMVEGNYAPLPALLYCFSMIDLLGALYAGNSDVGNLSKNAGNYMRKFMNYKPHQAKLLQDVYRHKTVHFSAPRTALSHNGKVISWKLHDRFRKNHLEIKPITRDIDIFGFGNIHCVGEFIVNIRVLKDDIKNSIMRIPNGYLAELQKDYDLRDKFIRIINEIYKY